MAPCDILTQPEDQEIFMLSFYIKNRRYFVLLLFLLQCQIKTLMWGSPKLPIGHGIVESTDSMKWKVSILRPRIKKDN